MAVSGPASYTVEVAPWLGCRAAIEQVRRTVFIEEQRIPECDEWDAIDPVATHVLAYVAAVAAKRDAVGTGRLEPTGKIGRVAVLPQYRGTRAGVAIMRRLMDLAGERGFTEVYLSAQTSARGFYERLGFQAEGPEFDEVGIPHQRMRRTVGKSDGQQAGHGGHTEHSVESR
jgi:predicted GNAT family N-acyltransferase